jgi:UDP-N-acetylglucosamine 2-epimerase
MINLACKERNNTQVYAYQHFPIAKNYLTCYPSQNIIESDLFPYILTSDRYWANCLNSVGCKKHSTLGNFRFQVIEQNSNIKPKSFLNRLEKKAALCACSIQFEDSIELIAKTIEILKLLDKEFSLRLKVNVNFHPLMPKNQIDFIQQSFSKDQNFINWSLKKADDLLQDAFLVFYNSNSICFNAAALGIPSVYIFSDTQINLDRISEISISGTSLEAIAKEIAKLCKDSNLYAQKCGDFYKFFKKYYIPPNFERFEELLIRRNT